VCLSICRGSVAFSGSTFRGGRRTCADDQRWGTCRHNKLSASLARPWLEKRGSFRKSAFCLFRWVGISGGGC
jgi:hypothetical protein